jgi:WD40 repeat protein
VLSVAYQPAGNGAFLSAGGDGELKIRLPEGKRFTVHAHDGPMFQAGYSASERHVYTVGADRTAKVWDLPTRSAESSSSRNYERASQVRAHC